ncbi:MAG TPA: hypothetical protein VL652_38600 [Kutzneria sp.]|nr:hypothetical protein [Kutzneria sp.]
MAAVRLDDLRTDPVGDQPLRFGRDRVVLGRDDLPPRHVLGGHLRHHAAQRFGGDGTLRERGDPVPASCPLAQAARLTLEDLRSMPLVDDPGSLPGWRGDSAPRRRPLVAVEERLEALAYTRHRTMPEIQHFADIARRYLNRPNQK